MQRPFNIMPQDITIEITPCFMNNTSRITYHWVMRRVDVTKKTPQIVTTGSANSYKKAANEAYSIFKGMMLANEIVQKTFDRDNGINKQEGDTSKS